MLKIIHLNGNFICPVANLNLNKEGPSKEQILLALIQLFLHVAHWYKILFDLIYKFCKEEELGIKIF